MANLLYPAFEDGHLFVGPTFNHENIPTDAIKQALTGTYGTPGTDNKFVTETDPKFLDPIKFAQGKTIGFGGSGDSSRTVSINLTDLTTTSGVILGSSGFDYKKTLVLVCFAGASNSESWGPGNSLISSNPYSTSPYVFRIAENSYGDHVHQGTYWFAVELKFDVR
jgi:hypothetical protein